MSGSICFTETLRGQLAAPQPAAGTVLALMDLQVALDAALPRGMAGVQGRIIQGCLQASWLCPQALTVLEGRVEILRQTAANSCEMRYDLLCAAPPGVAVFGGGSLLRVLGVKDVSHHSGYRWPRALWVETTRLRLDLYAVAGAVVPADIFKQLPASPAQPLASGVVRIHGAGFVRQLLSLRSHSPQGRWQALRNLLGFLRFFVARLARVYGGTHARA